ncbi:MAG: 30S ribosomal protein S6 [Candidatus Dormibacteraeota bacterium]|nr:30S ribosomal protein S6 [Candidatus Dormibacteraeota bacterium]
MNRDYEILYIVRPELDEDQLGQAVKTVNKLIEDLGGASTKSDVWGRRRLAYEVQHVREGQYVLTDFQLDPDRVPEMESTLKISDTVFRHLVTRKPEATDGRKRRRLAKAAAAAEAAESVAAAAAADMPPPAAAEVSPAEPEAASAAREAVAPATEATTPEEDK